MDNPPIFTRDFVLICLATLLASSTQYFVITPLSIYLSNLGFGPEFIGSFIGSFAIGALIVRIPIGGAVDRYGARWFGLVGAGLLTTACLLYASIPFVPIALPWGMRIPLVLIAAGVVHSVGFSIFGTAANSFVAYTVPAARRGEAVGYYGTLINVAMSIAAGLSIVIATQFGFTFLFALAAAIATGAFLSTRALRENPRSATAPRLMRIERSVIAPGLAHTALAASNGMGLAFIPLFGLERGISNPGIYYTIVALTSIVFRIVGGRVTDAYGRLASIVPGLLLASIGLFIITQISSVEMLAFSGFVFGMGWASAAPAFQALVIDVSGNTPRGAAMATYWALVDLGVGLGSILGGWIAATFGYRGVFVAASLTPLLGLGIILTYSHLRSKPD